jgi:hypothetical protein
MQLVSHAETLDAQPQVAERRAAASLAGRLTQCPSPLTASATLDVLILGVALAVDAVLAYPSGKSVMAGHGSDDG